MSTLEEIEAAVDELPAQQQERLLLRLTDRLSNDRQRQLSPRVGQNVLDIAPVSLGAVLRPLTKDDDLLGEMLEGRP